MESLSERIIQSIGQASELCHRLVVLVPPSGAGETAVLQDIQKRTAAPLVNLLQEDPQMLIWYDQALTRSGE